MRADSFYEEFKHGLRFLGINWGDMSLAKIHTKKGYFFMEYGGRTFSFRVNKIKKKSDAKKA